MSQYRDGLSGLVAQVEAKRAAARERGARLGPALRSMLSPELAGELASLEATAASSRADLAGLTEADAALDALSSAYDRAFDLAPSLAECATELPDVVAPSSPAPWLIEERRAVQFREALAREATNAFGDMDIARWGDRAYVGRSEDAGVPFLLFTRIAPLRPTYDSSWPRYVLSLRTTMPETLPPLRANRKDVLTAVASALGGAKRIRLDDAALDDALWLSGSAATASLLGPTARSALVTLAPQEVTLDVSEGMATLEWSGELDPWKPQLFVESARDVLVGMRRELARQCAMISSER